MKVEVGQVWDDPNVTLLVVRDLGDDRFRCAVLHIERPSSNTVQSGDITTLPAFAIVHNARRIA